MRKIIIFSCLLALSSCGQQSVRETSSNSPDKYSLELMKVNPNMSRIKINLKNPNNSIVGIVSLCNGSTCTDFKSNEAETSDTPYKPYGDFLLKEAVYSSIIINKDGKQTSIPVSIDMKNGERGDLFIDISDAKANFGKVPFFSNRSVVVEPSGGEYEVDGKTKLVLATGAVNQPTVVSFQTYDTGGEYPLIDIFPEITLNKESEIKLSKLRNLSGNVTYSGRISPLYPEDSLNTIRSQSIQTYQKDSSLAVKINKLGRISTYTNESTIVSQDGERVVLGGKNEQPTFTSQAVGTYGSSITCKNRLANMLETYKLQLQNHYAIKIDDCTNVAPYVHIIVVDMKKSFYNPTITRFLKRSSPIEHSVYSLDTIGSHMSSYNYQAIGINGNVWKGGALNSGFTWDKGEDGDPQFTVMKDGRLESFGETSEAVISFSKNSGNGFSGYLQNLRSGSQGITALSEAIGSSTSIIKNGACSISTDDGYEMRSAIGFGNDRLVLVSSTQSGDKVSPRSLCAVFEGLNTFGGAVLLDGSNAAGMYYSGRHLNPVSDYLFAGGMRNIAFTFALAPRY